MAGNEDDNDYGHDNDDDDNEGHKREGVMTVLTVSCTSLSRARVTIPQSVNTSPL